MNKLYLLLRTLASYTIIGIITFVFIPPCFVIACLPARWRLDNRLFFRLLDIYFKCTFLATFRPVTMIGRENLPKVPSIFVGNHQSSLDIPVMGSLCNGFPHVWLVLAYYVDAPVLGFFVRRMFIPVDRAHAGKAARSLLQVYRFIKDHPRHLIIFPEGGRFIDGEIHPFFEGFAMLAKKTGRPVIPAFMPHNRIIYPPGSFYIYPGSIKIIVGEAFFYREDETDEQFTARVRDWFLKMNENEKVRINL